MEARGQTATAAMELDVPLHTRIGSRESLKTGHDQHRAAADHSGGHVVGYPLLPLITAVPSTPSQPHLPSANLVR